MTDVAEMKIIQSGKAKAPTNGPAAKGCALATVCIKYATKRMEQEEKEAGKLRMIVKSISELDHGAHVEFRAQLTAELTLLKELRATAGVTKAQTAGYSFASFEVLVTNWKTISTACELGYKPEDKPWGLVLAESVATKHGVASNDGGDVSPEGKKKVGRKATPLIDKAIKAAEALLTENPVTFMEFAAWVETTIKAMPKA